ncbi:MAG: hypothetical protein EA398_05450 [Deltaproteobacteria bacterium]|nr:MAG: hypothetical protein EA398_05450 [Deltaproteobacteria bacterium]
MLLAACAEDPVVPDRGALSGFEVRLVAPVEPGSPAFPLPFTTMPLEVELDIIARDRRGERMRGFDGEVRLTSVPGRIAEAERTVRLVEGRGSARVGLQYTYGDTRIWVQEQAPEGEMSSFGLGISPPLFFAEPRVRNVRFNPDNPAGLSPLFGREARIGEGILMVTNVVANGFYATDVGDALPDWSTGREPRGVGQEPWTSLFVFTFNFPDGITIGDRLCSLAGGVAEFQGQTQLTFPNYIIQGVGRVGEVPDEAFLDPADPGAPGACAYRTEVDGSLVQVLPHVLDEATLGDNTLVRAWDSALVRIEGGVLSTRFDDCDFDGSGQIEGADERACRSRCQRDLTCTEMSSLRQFDQFSASVGGIAFEVADATRAAGYDPLAGCAPHAGVEGDPDDPPGYRCGDAGRQLRSVTGSLRLVDLGGVVLRVVIPRFETDLVFAP